MNEQELINQEILSSLHDILGQNRQVVQAIDNQRTHFDDEMGQIKQKIDNLERTLTKKATFAGAVAGAVTGTVSGGLFTAAMEIVKLKYGG